MTSVPYLLEADRPTDRTVRLLLHVAFWCLAVHTVLTLGSAFAFATFLAPPFPDWLMTPQNMAVYAHGMKYGGPTTVVFGAFAGILHAMGRLGTGRALLIFALSFGISLGSELAGTGTGLPFGVYGYTPLLGYKIGNLVPFNIPTSWFFMLYASLAICGRLLPAKDDGASKWWWAFVGGLVLTAWDVSLDPAMVKNQFWLWSVPDLSGTTETAAWWQEASLALLTAPGLAEPLPAGAVRGQRRAADRHLLRAGHGVGRRLRDAGDGVAAVGRVAPRAGRPCGGRGRVAAAFADGRRPLGRARRRLSRAPAGCRRGARRAPSAPPAPHSVRTAWGSWWG